MGWANRRGFLVAVGLAPRLAAVYPPFQPSVLGASSELGKGALGLCGPVHAARYGFVRGLAGCDEGHSKTAVAAQYIFKPAARGKVKRLQPITVLFSGPRIWKIFSKQVHVEIFQFLETTWLILIFYLSRPFLWVSYAYVLDVFHLLSCFFICWLFLSFQVSTQFIIYTCRFLWQKYMLFRHWLGYFQFFPFIRCFCSFLFYYFYIIVCPTFHGFHFRK